MTGVNTRQRPVIRTAASQDLHPVITLMAAGLAHSDLGQHVIADEHAREQVLWRYCRIVVPHAMTYGQVDVIGRGQAAAIWYHITGSRKVTIPGYGIRLAQAAGPYLARFVELDRARAEHHPTDRPHHHLAYLAVRPDRRGHNLGTQLLEHHHRQLDASNTHAYVEATGEQGTRLFARHGYRPMNPYPAGPAAPQLYPMWRNPRE
jgi:GNAT superfamily N-acetyltransferase